MSAEISLVSILPASNSFWDLPTLEDAKLKYEDVCGNSGRQLIIIKRKPFEGRPESVLNPWMETEHRWVNIEGWREEGSRSNGYRTLNY